ncbi:MAG: sigma-70 family RNA polymerase sigma factor [Planctomycetes bacterium]|nr:sigma-70 family RNA polymerase sigma factor [Planctomycetota bacterium]
MTAIKTGEQLARKISEQQTEKVPRPTARHATPTELRSIEKKHPDDRTDFDLLKLYVKKKSTEAFEALVQRHRRQVYNFVYKMVGKAESAEDIFQETFLRVIKNAHTYTPRAKFTTWCLQIARNLCLDYFKREGLRQHVSIDASPLGDDRSFAGLLQGTDPESGEILISRELVEEVRQAVTQLPDNQREALVLRMYDDMPYAEIAEVLASPEGTVKYWVHEAVNTLARHLERKGLK